MVSKIKKLCDDYLGVLLGHHNVPGIILLEEAEGFYMAMRLYYAQGHISTDEYIKAITLWNNKYRKERIPLHYNCHSWNSLCEKILFCCKKLSDDMYSDNFPKPEVARIKIESLMDLDNEEAMIVN